VRFTPATSNEATWRPGVKRPVADGLVVVDDDAGARVAPDGAGVASRDAPPEPHEPARSAAIVDTTTVDAARCVVGTPQVSPVRVRAA
jgi:hypothetical protein